MIIHIQSVVTTVIGTVDENGNTTSTQQWQQQTGILSAAEFEKMYQQIKTRMDELRAEKPKEIPNA